MGQSSKEYHRLYEESHKYPCPLCGTLIHRKSKLCKKCYQITCKGEKHFGWKGGREVTLKRFYQSKKHPCIDCGKPAGYKSIRCKSCATKLSSKNYPRVLNAKYRFIKDGYIYIKKPDCPRANTKGYVREHIFIWERAHNKSLPKGWIVHHLNGIKTDNRINNLVALPEQKHRLILQAKAKRIQELEALLNHQKQLL